MRRGASEVGAFRARAPSPIFRPAITPLGPPQTNLRGSFVLSYRIEDDYGARDAQVVAKPGNRRRTARNARALVPAAKRLA